MAIDAEMVDEVKRLISEGFSEDKVHANLIKIGYSEEDAKEMLLAAKGMVKAPTTGAVPRVVTPTPERMLSEDDVLLAAESEIDSEEPVSLPKPASAAKQLPTPPPAPAPAVSKMAEVPEAVEEQTTNGGVVIFIFLATAVAIFIMAYLILFPKLGIKLF